MEKKQTAVEWFNDNRKKQSAVEWLYSIVKIEYPEFNDTVLWLALNMEKEQIIVAYNEGYDLRDDLGSLSTNPTGEQYYNQIYGKETDNIGMDIR